MNLYEYRVRPVVRYGVTEFHQVGEEASVTVIGEFDNEAFAEKAKNALEQQAKCKTFVAVLRKFDVDTQAMFFQTFDEAKKFAIQRFESKQEDWQIFSH